MPPGVAHIRLDGDSRVRASVQRNDAMFVDHLVEEGDESWCLDDAMTIPVDLRNHRADDAQGDAAIVQPEILGPVEWAVAVGALRGTRLPLLRLRCQRRHSSVRRLDDERGLPECPRQPRGIFADGADAPVIWRPLGVVLAILASANIRGFAVRHALFWAPRERRKTFANADWRLVCKLASEAFRERGLIEIVRWIDGASQNNSPRKSDQDGLDACLCLLVGLYLAERKDCLMVGDLRSGYIVVPHSGGLRSELEARCKRTGREPSKWVRTFQLLTSPS